MISEQPQVRYDVPALVTYMLTGLGIGYVCALLFAPRWRAPAENIAVSRIGDSDRLWDETKEQSPAL